jgi:hypothetical protein
VNGEEEVGTIGEEAAKLLEALQGWAAGAAGSGAGEAAEAAGGLGERLSDLHEHLATGATECSYCPLCRAIALFRETTPEVRTHLSVAASSLLQAAAGLLETRVPTARPASGVEKIDLDDDGSGWDAE